MEAGLGASAVSIPLCLVLKHLDSSLPKPEGQYVTEWLHIAHAKSFRDLARSENPAMTF